MIRLNPRSRSQYMHNLITEKNNIYRVSNQQQNRINQLKQIESNKQRIAHIQQNIQNNHRINNYLKNLNMRVNQSNGLYIQNIHRRQQVINQIQYIQQQRIHFPITRIIPQQQPRPQQQVVNMQELIRKIRMNLINDTHSSFTNPLPSSSSSFSSSSSSSYSSPSSVPVIKQSAPLKNYIQNIIQTNERVINGQINNSSACLYLYHSADLLTQWIIHNKKLGFDHLYIIDANYSNERLEYLSKEINKGYITYEDGKKQNGISITPETVANIFYQKYHHSTKWMIVLEIDEFIVLKKHFSINTFINEYQQFAGISIIRFLYGSNNYIEHRDNVFESYTKRVDDNILTGQFYYKPLVQTAQVTNLNKYDAGYKNGKFSVDETKTFVTGEKPKRIRNDIIQINAYVLRSYDDFMNKITNMPATIAKTQEINGTNIHSMYYFNTLNRICLIEDRSILEHHYPVKKMNIPLDTDGEWDRDSVEERQIYPNTYPNTYTNNQEHVNEENQINSGGNIFVVYNEIKVVNQEESVIPLSTVSIEEIQNQDQDQEKNQDQDQEQNHYQDDEPIIEEVEDIQTPQVNIINNVTKNMMDNATDNREDDIISIISQKNSKVNKNKNKKKKKNK